jgi:hypothetical protein
MSAMQAAPRKEKIMDHRIAAAAMNSPGLTEPDFCGWLSTAAPGDTLEYHRGFLLLDIRPDGSRLAPADRKTLVRIARRAFWAAEQGWVHLVQRRHGPDDYSYLAIVRPWPRTPRSVLVAALAEELPE